MTDPIPLNTYGVLSEPATLTIERMLPGPIELVWAALVESELRRQWLAAGEMEMKLGAAFEFVWRNDELTDRAVTRPAGFAAEQRMRSRITALDPPRRLSFTWEGSGDVSFTLAPKGDKVLLTVTHRRLADRGTLLGVSAGWHMHLDILVVRAAGIEPEPFWDGWIRLRKEYDRRLAA